MKTIKQNANDFAFKGSSSKPVNQSNVCVQNGGIGAFKGGKHKLTNVVGTGDIEGHGVYRILVATTPGTELEIDNRGLPDAQNCYLTNGDEAVVRIMGKAKRVVLSGLKFLCRKWKDKNGKIDWFKGWGAFRDAVLVVLTGGEGVGPWDCGEQDDSLTAQSLKQLVLDGVGLTHMPRISRPDAGPRKGKSGVKSIKFIRCPKLREVFDKKNPLKFLRTERVIENGKPAFWPDKTLHPK